MALRKRGKFWVIDLLDPENLLPGSFNGRYRKSTYLTNKHLASQMHSEIELALARLRMGLTAVFADPVKPVTLADLKDTFLKYATPRKEATTIQLDVSALERLIGFYGEGHLSNQLDGNKFQQYLLTNVFHRSNSDFSGHPLSKTTVNIYINHLTAIWTWAVEQGMANINPFANTKRLKTDKKLRRPFSKADLISLLAVIDNPLFRNLVLFALLTGMRRSELTQISVNGDVDIQNGLIYARVRKDDEPLIIPITSLAYTLIKDRLQEDKLFPFRNDFVTQKMRKYVNKAEIPPELTFHSLRHTTPTVLFQRNANPRKIQRLMGHSDLKMTEHYIQYAGEDLLEPMGIMETFVEELIND